MSPTHSNNTHVVKEPEAAIADSAMFLMHSKMEECDTTEMRSAVDNLDIKEEIKQPDNEKGDGQQ